MTGPNPRPQPQAQCYREHTITLHILGFFFLLLAFNGDVLCMSITSLQDDEGKSFWKVLVGLSTSGHKPGCNQLVEMTVTQELLKGWRTLLYG